MKKIAYVAGILIVAGILVFMLAPILPWAGPVTVDTRPTGQVSPSYYLLNCGVVSNLAIVFIENGQVAAGGSGTEWRCLHP